MCGFIGGGSTGAPGGVADSGCAPADKTGLFLRIIHLAAASTVAAFTILSCVAPRGGESQGSIEPGSTVGGFIVLTPGILPDLVSPPYALNEIGWVSTQDASGIRVDVHGPVVHQGATQTINEWRHRKRTGYGETTDTDTGTPLFRVSMTFTPAAQVDGTHNKYEYRVENLTSDLTGMLFRVANPNDVPRTMSAPPGWSVRQGSQSFVWDASPNQGGNVFAGRRVS